ncbi:Uncharacterised protein [Actinobacillus equuli]|nr:Uncharacterised protein [Actinobacillus equuli]
MFSTLVADEPELLEEHAVNATVQNRLQAIAIEWRRNFP